MTKATSRVEPYLKLARQAFLSRGRTEHPTVDKDRYSRGGFSGIGENSYIPPPPFKRLEELQRSFVERLSDADGFGFGEYSRIPFIHARTYHEDVRRIISMVSAATPTDPSPLAIDIGSGWGIIARELAHRGLSAIGIEPCEKVIRELARSWGLREIYDGVFAHPEFDLCYVISDLESAASSLNAFTQQHNILITLGLGMRSVDPISALGQIQPKVYIHVEGDVAIERGKEDLFEGASFGKIVRGYKKHNWWTRFRRYSECYGYSVNDFWQVYIKE